MKHKNIITVLFIIACSYTQAQDITLDGQKAVVAGPGKVQTISDILPMGNWLPSKALDSLKAGDTLVLTNDNVIREGDMSFSKEGKVNRYQQHMQTTHQKDGGNTIDITNSWDAIGSWHLSSHGEIEVTGPYSPPYSSGQTGFFVFTEISKSYKVIKLVTSSINIMSPH